MKYLFNIRKEKKLSSIDMAKEIGVSHSLYTKVECGQREPSRIFMKKLKSTFPEIDMNIFFNDLLHKKCNKIA